MALLIPLKHHLGVNLYMYEGSIRQNIIKKNRLINNSNNNNENNAFNHKPYFNHNCFCRRKFTRLPNCPQCTKYSVLVKAVLH